MSHLPITFFILTFTIANFVRSDNGFCDNFNADFNIRDAIGSWKVAAMIPGTLFPKNKTVQCYKVEFSESDIGSIKWLVNKTADTEVKPEAISETKEGIVIRQRYYSKTPFDVWSKAVGNVSGCFEQVLALNHTGRGANGKVRAQKEKMQLHILDVGVKSKPLLLQLLWGKMISAVIYSRSQDVNMLHLQLAAETVTKLRGKQLPLKTCEQRLEDVSILN